MQTQNAFSNEKLEEMNSAFWDEYFQGLDASLFERAQYKYVVETNNFDCIVDVYPRRFNDGDGVLVPALRLAGYIRHIHAHPDLDGIEFEFGNVTTLDFMTKNCYEWVSCNIYRKGRAKPFSFRAHADEVLNRATLRPKERIQQIAFILAAKIAFPLPGMYIAEDEESGSVEAVNVTVNTPGAALVAAPAVTATDRLVQDLVADVQTGIAGLAGALPGVIAMPERTPTLDSLSVKDREIVQMLLEARHTDNMDLCRQFLAAQADDAELAYRLLAGLASDQPIVTDDAEDESPTGDDFSGDSHIFPVATTGLGSAHPYDFLGDGQLGDRIDM